MRDQVWDSYRFERGLPETHDPAAALAFEGTAEERQAIDATLSAARRLAEEREQRERQRYLEVKRVEARVRSVQGQSLGTAANGALGLAIGLAIVKGLSLGLQQLRRWRKPKPSKGGKSQKSRSAPVAPSARHHQSSVTPSRGSAPAAAAATAAQQTSSAPARPPAGASSSSKQSQSKATEADSQPKARARASTRKR